MNKNSRGTINLRENWHKESLLGCLPVLLYLYTYGES